MLLHVSHSVVSDSLQPMDWACQAFLQARILEWVAIPFSRGSSKSKGGTRVSCIAGRVFTIWGTREAPMIALVYANKAFNKVDHIFIIKKITWENQNKRKISNLNKVYLLKAYFFFKMCFLIASFIKEEFEEDQVPSFKRMDKKM